MLIGCQSTKVYETQDAASIKARGDITAKQHSSGWLFFKRVVQERRRLEADLGMVSSPA